MRVRMSCYVDYFSKYANFNSTGFGSVFQGGEWGYFLSKILSRGAVENSVKRRTVVCTWLLTLLAILPVKKNSFLSENIVAALDS